MILRILAAASMGLLAAACQAPQQTRYLTPAGTPVASATYWTSEQACSDVQ